MLLPIPNHDCLVPGLGLYASHEYTNPLAGTEGAEQLYDETLSFHLEREDGNEELNLAPGIHFPLRFGQLRSRKKVATLRKPSTMEAMFIAVQHGFEILFVGFETKESGGMHLLQLHVLLRNPESPGVIPMQPQTLHRYIKQN